MRNIFTFILLTIVSIGHVLAADPLLPAPTPGIIEEDQAEVAANTTVDQAIEAAQLSANTEHWVSADQVPPSIKDDLPSLMPFLTSGDHIFFTKHGEDYKVYKDDFVNGKSILIGTFSTSAQNTISFQTKSITSQSKQVTYYTTFSESTPKLALQAPGPSRKKIQEALTPSAQKEIKYLESITKNKVKVSTTPSKTTKQTLPNNQVLALPAPEPKLGLPAPGPSTREIQEALTPNSKSKKEIEYLSSISKSKVKILPPLPEKQIQSSSQPLLALPAPVKEKKYILTSPELKNMTNKDSTKSSWVSWKFFTPNITTKKAVVQNRSFQYSSHSVVNNANQELMVQ